MCCCRKFVSETHRLLYLRGVAGCGASSCLGLEDGRGLSRKGCAEEKEHSAMVSGVGMGVGSA